MVRVYTKEEAIKILSVSAKDYYTNLLNRNFIIIYKDRSSNKIECFETVFLTRNFQHLSGIEFIDNNGNVLKQSNRFFNKCLNNSLSKKEIRFRKDGTTNLKLTALPKVVNFFKSSRMTTTMDTYQPLLQVDRFIGNISYCLGFAKEEDYYVPSSCLLRDIRGFGDNPSQILAILSKPGNKDHTTYRDLKYTAKGVELSNLALPKEVSKLIERT